MPNESGSKLTFEGASAATLRSIAARMRSGQLPVPLSAFALSGIAGVSETLKVELIRLTAEGMSSVHLAVLLDTAAQAVEAELRLDQAAELVWTGPETAVAHSRDTSVVVEELFGSAQQSVLVSTFVIQQGQGVFASLATRMDAVPNLEVRLFLHVPRGWNDTRADAEILREFGDALARQWPGVRRPATYYDPRGLSTDASSRATWHAKCVLIDDRVAFVTSANFTEWAQQRNAEAGILVRNQHFARQLRGQFDALVASKQVRRLPGW